MLKLVDIDVLPKLKIPVRLINNDTYYYIDGYAAESINSCPDLGDSIPPVYCKDCKHAEAEFDNKHILCNNKKFSDTCVIRDKDWFCADGEHKFHFKLTTGDKLNESES